MSNTKRKGKLMVSFQEDTNQKIETDEWTLCDLTESGSYEGVELQSWEGRDYWRKWTDFLLHHLLE